MPAGGLAAWVNAQVAGRGRASDGDVQCDRARPGWQARDRHGQRLCGAELGLGCAKAYPGVQDPGRSFPGEPAASAWRVVAQDVGDDVDGACRVVERHHHQPERGRQPDGLPRRASGTPGVQPELPGRADHPQHGPGSTGAREHGYVLQLGRHRRRHRRRPGLLRARHWRRVHRESSGPGPGHPGRPWRTPGQARRRKDVDHDGPGSASRGERGRTEHHHHWRDRGQRPERLLRQPTRPLASNLNYLAGQTISNMVLVPLGPGNTLTFYNSAGTVNVIADVLGYFAPGAGGGVTGVTPVRVLDTRIGVGALQAKLGSGKALTLTVPGLPAGTTAVALNVTITG